MTVNDIISSLRANNKKKVNCRVVLTSAPKVVNEFKKHYEDMYNELYRVGVTISSICPLMYTNNPLVHSKAIMTNSNKLRTYSMARYFKDEEILRLITK